MGPGSWDRTPQKWVQVRGIGFLALRNKLNKSGPQGWVQVRGIGPPKSGSKFVGRNKMRRCNNFRRLSRELRCPTLSKPSAMIPAYEKPSTGGGRKKKLGRKAGFEGKSRTNPTRIDRIESHKIERCPDCGTSVKQEKTPRVRLVEDLPKEATSEVTKHEIYRGWCPKCQKKVEPVVTDALPNSQIGLRLIAFTAWLHYALGTTISQVMGVLNFHLLSAPGRARV